MNEKLPSTLLLEIVTPQRLLLSEEVSEVIAPGTLGYFGVLPGHIPFVSNLSIGELTYRKGTEERHLAIIWGYAEVLPDRVVILAEEAQKPEEIDVARAEAARDRALAHLQKSGPETDLAEEEASLRRAMVRLQVSSHKH
jgi:F-type H+-transporting ATPase subunit epsilon